MIRKTRKSYDEVDHLDNQTNNNNNIVPDNNNIVCKHSSVTNVSLSNPGLLIVEQESNMDSHSFNAQVLPNPLSIKRQPSYELKEYNQSSNMFSHKKNSSPKKKRKFVEKKDYTSTMPMQIMMTHSSSPQTKQFEQITSTSSTHNPFKINIESINDTCDLENQVNYERYLSKSNIVRSSSNNRSIINNNTNNRNF